MQHVSLCRRSLRSRDLGTQGSKADGAQSCSLHFSQAAYVPCELQGVKYLFVRQLYGLVCCEQMLRRPEEDAAMESGCLPRRT